MIYDIEYIKNSYCFEIDFHKSEGEDFPAFGSMTIFSMENDFKEGDSIEVFNCIFSYIDSDFLEDSEASHNYCHYFSYGN